MEAIFERAALYEAVHAVSGALNVRAPRPALQCVHFAATKDAVVVSATDLRIAIRRHLSAKKVVSEGDAAVQGSRLGSLLREVTDDEVHVKIDEKTASVAAGRSSFKLVAQDPADFAELPELKKGALSLPAPILDTLVRRTIFAAAQEQGRYAIDGVSVSVVDGKMEMAATDGRRLAVATAEVGGGALGPCVVPPKMLAEIARQTGGAGEVGLKVAGGRLLARVGETLVAGALLEGAFPAYRDMIPAPAEPAIRVGASALASKLRQAAQLTSEDSRAVVITASRGAIRVEAKSAGVGEASIEMDAAYEGPEMSVAFNARYLLDVLPEFGDDEIVVEIPASDRPAVIRTEGYVYVLAPVRVSA
ncbi:MAG: DNA polymerase III subunit beta [Planctomycetota bacterium]|jgi:DNA polymerase-3 subunit beta